MMKWLGMNRKITPIWPDATLAEKQTNLRMRVAGEIQRRNGFASSSVAKQATPILALVPIGAASGPSIIVMPSNGSVQGYTSPVPSWGDVALVPPTITVSSVCTPYANADAGTDSHVTTFTLAAGACVGTLVVTGAESARSAPFCGYQFTATADGVNILTSGCLVNSSTSATVPANTTSLVITVTSGCSGAGAVGTWSVSAST